MNDIFGIPVEVLDSIHDGQVLLVNRKTWEQMKSAEPTTARPWTGASRMSDECGNRGPDGATCIKPPTHHGRHGGIDRIGDWRSWL